MAAADFIPAARAIPSSFAESARSWWSAGEKASADSEERLLRRLPFYRSSAAPATPEDGPLVAFREKIELNTPKHYINTVSMKSTAPSSDAPPPAVLLHGYGAGLGFFWPNLNALGQWASKHKTSAYALDWLGMGRSARVPFKMKAKREDTAARVHEAESFFVESLEEWRTKMGIEQMTLIGHSLGGYFSVVYALRYPQRVNKLILLSPAGIPHDPNSTTQPSREITDDAASISSSAPSQPEPATTSNVEKIRKDQKQAAAQESRSRRLLKYLWDEGWTPFQVVRGMLFYAPLMVGKYTARRFVGLSEEETRDMHEYILNITLAKGSGENCMFHILSPGAHARLPLVDRVDALKIPVTFAYGDHDWMDPQGGKKAVEKLRAAGNGEGRMYIIPNAGHHLYLDAVSSTNKLVIKELERVHRSRSAGSSP